MAKQEGGGISFLLWLFCVCSSLAGVQFVYSIQFAVGTPLFNDELKLSTTYSTIILSTAGPVSGFIVQPIVGVLSDSSTSRFGRRRPFILGGMIVCALGMALIANAPILGSLLGDNPSGNNASDHKIAIVFAIIGLWIMNLCVNIVQGPARAIIADIVPESQQQTGNAMVSGVMGLAAIIANVVGAQFFGRPEPYKWLFLVGVGFVLLATIPTMLAAREVQYVDEERIRVGNNPIEGSKTGGNTIGGVFRKIFIGFKTMPGSMARITLVYFLSWCAFSPYMIFISDYFGKNVYGGDPSTDATLYQSGVKMAMYGLAIFAGVQWIYSILLPGIIKATNVKFSYFISQFIASACFILLLFYPHPLYVPIILMAAIAPNFTTFNSIPFALIGTNKNAGLYMGVLNSASVVAQTVTNLACSGILHFTNKNDGYCIAFGGIISIIACLCVFVIQTSPKEDPEKAPLISENSSVNKA